MILLRYSGRRFVTTIVVGSQGYVEYGAPADEKKYTTQSTCIVSSQYDCNGAAITAYERYMYVCLGGTFFGQCGAWSSIHPNDTYDMYAYKIASFINHLHEQYFA